MDSFLDDHLDSPGGSVMYQDVRVAVIADVRSEICNPVVVAFQSICWMTGDEIDCFDPLSTPGVPLLHPDFYSVYPSDEDSATGREKPRFKYFHRIGQYETSSFYKTTKSFFRMSAFVRLANLWCWRGK
jgi:hypothetical protein